MNKARREQLRNLGPKLAHIENLLDEVRAELESIRDDEQEYYDNMPESFQSGDKGQTAETAISQLEDAIGMFDDFSIDTLSGYIDEAAQ